MEISELNNVASLNMYDMSLMLETSQADRSPSKDEAPSNIYLMSVTRERSGTSAALYVMLDAPLNAECIDVHRESPHWSIDISLCASAWLSRRISSMSPDMRTVWIPAESYVWV